MENTTSRINHFYNTYQSNKIINKCFCLYENKIDDFLEEGKPFSKELLQLLYVVSNFIMRKEETIEEISNKYELKVNKPLIDNLLNQITDKPLQNNECIIGGIRFKDPIDFINTLRNKFAHGAYLYDNEKKSIVISVNEKDIYISLEWLIIFNRLVLVEINKTKTDGYYTEGIIKIKKNSFSHISTFKDFKRSLLDMKYYEFIVSPKDQSKKYNEYENGIISKLISSVCNDFNNQENCDKSIRNVKEYCESKDLNLEINILPISSFTEEEKSKLKNMYQNCIDFNKIDIGGQVQMIAQWIMDIRLNKNPIDHISQGYTVVQDFISYLNLGRSYKTFSEVSPKSVLFYDKCIAAIFLAQFNIVYAYNAEYLYEDNLDYSKLDLSKIKYTINKFEDLKLIQLESELESLNIRINNAILEVDQAENHLNKLLEAANKNKDPKKNYEKGKMVLLEKLNLEQLKLEHLKKAYDETEKIKVARLLDIETKRKYYENKNIISHIRNSLAHGNFEFDRFGEEGNFNKATIHFKDIYKGENTFDSVLSLEDFVSLFSSHNYKVILDMCTDLTLNKNRTI